MRLQLLSDLHLEFAPFEVPAREADLVVLAGDLHQGEAGLQWIRRAFPSRPVVYVLGNHEFYRDSLPGLTERLQKEAQGSNVHVLERSSAVIAGYRFLGCTLWTDFQLKGDAEWSMGIAERIMSDYLLVFNSAEQRDLRARDTVNLHQQSRAWLEEELASGDPKRTIVVTHHAPSSRGEPARHRESQLAPAFASNLDGLVEKSGIPLWIYGHTHHNVDYRLGRTRVLSNQRGYPDESCAGFDPGMTVEIG